MIGLLYVSYKMKKITLYIWLLSGACFADPSQSTLDALKVPNSVDVEVHEKSIKLGDLPDGLLKKLKTHDWGGGTGELPQTVSCKLVDLNNDGRKEYFTRTSMGGSGGPLYLIFTKTEGDWQYIGESSNFVLLPKKSGWHPIVSFGRSGPYYFKSFREYRSGKYQCVEIHEILDGKISITKAIEQNAAPTH